MTGDRRTDLRLVELATAHILDRAFIFRLPSFALAALRSGFEPNMQTSEVYKREWRYMPLPARCKR